MFLLIMFQIKKSNGAETHNMRAKTFTNIYDIKEKTLHIKEKTLHNKKSLPYSNSNRYVNR